MAVAGEPWQLECEKMEQKCGYLLTSGLWSDCTFMVGSETNQVAVPAHKLILALASPVFEAMFYGGLSERNDPIVLIPDLQPQAFRAMLQYIYTGNTDIGSFDMAWDLWYGAKKYMLPHLVNKCNTYISSVLGPKNVCRAYEFASLFDEKTLMDKCLKIISTNTKEVLKDNGFVDVHLNTVIKVFSLDQLNVNSELDLFNALSRYAEAEQKRHSQEAQFSPEDGQLPSEELAEKLLSLSVDSSSQTSPATELDSKPPSEVVTSETIADKKKFEKVGLVPDEPTIRGALQKIRFLSLSATQFAEGPALSDLLTKSESFAVLMNMASRASPERMPTGFSKCRGPRTESMDECIKTGCLEHIIKALKSGIPSQVKDAARAVDDLLNETSRVQEALDAGILDALVPALTEGDDECQKEAVWAITNLCRGGSAEQLDLLLSTGFLEPYCGLLLSPDHPVVLSVLQGLNKLLKGVNVSMDRGICENLQEIGVPELLKSLKLHKDEKIRLEASYLMLLMRTSSIRNQLPGPRRTDDITNSSTGQKPTVGVRRIRKAVRRL